MTTTQQPEALVFADDRPTSTSDDLYQWAIDAEDLIRAQHARIEELEALLSAIGAGGVEPLRKAAKTGGKKDATDWKEIALALAQRVNFAVTNLSCKGYGMLDLETRKFQSWREYMAEGLEMVPGIVVDREILATLELSPAQRKKAQAEIEAKRTAQSAKQEVQP